MMNLKKSISILFIVLIFSLIFLTQLNVSNVPGTYVPKDLESFRLLKDSENYFRNDETMIFVFKLRSKLNKDELTHLSSFVAKIKNMKSVNKVYSVFDYEYIQGNEEGFEISNIIDASNISNLKLEDVSQKVKKDRFIKDLLVNQELDTFTVVIEPNFESQSLKRYFLEENIFSLIKKESLFELLQGYAGDFAIDMVQFRESITLMLKIIPIVIGVGLLLIYLLFNSFVGVAIAGASNGIVSLFTVSLIGLFHFDFNLITSVIPTLMMALSTAFVIHLYNSIAIHRKEGDVYHSVIEAVEEIKKPSFYSALTTAVGLFSLSFSDIPPLRAVGITCGLGVLFVYVLVIYFLPSIIVKFCHSPFENKGFFNSFLDKIVMFFTNLAISHPKSIVTSFILVTLLLTPQLYKVVPETNLYKFFADDHPINKSMNVLKEKFVGVSNIVLLFSDPTSKQLFLSPEFNKKIDLFKSEVLKIKNVDRVFSATDILKQLNWAFNGESENSFKVPETKELTEQYLFVYDGEDLYDNLTREFDKAKLVINLSVESANKVEQVYLQVKEIAERIFKEEEFTYGYSGYGKVFSDQENLVINDLFKSIYISSILIFLIMLVLWKSVKSTVLCMIPNYSPILGMFIVMGVSGIWLDLGTAMIASIALGIAVDDTIHVFAGISDRMDSLGMDAAIRETFRISGRAVIMTTVLLSVQFSILMISEFKPLQHFGSLTSLGLVFALIFDLLFLPALIKISYRDKLNS